MWLGVLSIFALFKVLGILLMIKWDRYGYYVFSICSFVSAFIIISLLKQNIVFGITEIAIACFTYGVLLTKKDDISAWKYMDDGWDYKHCRHIYQLFGFFVFLFAVLTCIYVNPQAEETSSKDVEVPDSIILARAVEQLDFEKTFNDGVSTIDSLANKRMPEAIYKKAYLYMWCPNDDKNAKYKKRMGIAIVKDGDFKGMPQSDSINNMAVRLLQDVVHVTDSTHVEAMYYLGFYYANGIILDRNYNQAKSLFEKAQIQAQKSRNSNMIGKIESVLMNIKETNYE